MPHLHQDWARPCHNCIRIGLASFTPAPRQPRGAPTVLSGTRRVACAQLQPRGKRTHGVAWHGIPDIGAYVLCELLPTARAHCLTTRVIIEAVFVSVSRFACPSIARSIALRPPAPSRVADAGRVPLVPHRRC